MLSEKNISARNHNIRHNNNTKHKTDAQQQQKKKTRHILIHYLE